MPIVDLDRFGESLSVEDVVAIASWRHAAVPQRLSRSCSAQLAAAEDKRIAPPFATATPPYVVCGVCDEDGDAGECVVCFEELASVGGAVPLPCSCRALYCGSCWDRALNASFEQTQAAQCPTCRTAMRVDFDPESGKLKFASQGSGGEAARDALMRIRLQEQARPRQIRLLEQHGAKVALGVGEDHHGPECVCGSRLVQVTVHDRVLAWVAQALSVSFEEAEDDAKVMEVAGNYLDGTLEVPLTCDVCQCLDGPGRIDLNGSVWTCEAGSSTIIHGRSFDVCEGCYASHVRIKFGE